MYILIDIRCLREEIEETPGLLDTYGEGLYMYWLDNHGERYIRRWLIDNDYNIDTVMTKKYVKYIANHFREWLSNTK